MKVTVQSKPQGDPIAMVAPEGELLFKVDSGKVFMIRKDGSGVYLENLHFKEEVALYINTPGTKLIYHGDLITIRF